MDHAKQMYGIVSNEITFKKQMFSQISVHNNSEGIFIYRWYFAIHKMILVFLCALPES